MPYDLRSTNKKRKASDEGGEEDTELAKRLDEFFDLNLDADNIYECPEIYMSEFFNERDDEFIDKTVGRRKNKYKKLLKRARRLMCKSIVTLPHILDSQAPISVKAELVQQYDEMIRINYYETDFIVLNKKIKDALNMYNSMKPADLSNEAPSCTILSRIMNSDLSDNNKARVVDKYKHMIALEHQSYEYNNLQDYISYALKLREKSIQTVENKVEKEEIPKFVINLREKLDSVIYGQYHAKEEIIDNVVNRMVNSEIGNITVLHGEPGVGKTHLVRKLASVLGYKFHHISLGGQTSPDKILGSLSVYNNSKPGEIYLAMSEMGCNNGIILLDEFDKISSKETFYAFLNILDPSQNMAFRDNFLHDLTIDLSKVWFVISLNNFESIDPIVKDRLKNVVHFKSYNECDKTVILNQFFIPEAKAKYKITEDIKFDEASMHKLTKYEAGGVRDLKNSIDLVFKRLSVLSMTKNSEYKPSYFIEDYNLITLTKLDKLMGKNKVDDTIPFGMYV